MLDRILSFIEYLLERARAKSLGNYYNIDGGNISTRPASANITSDNSGSVIQFLATSSMTEGKPYTDGSIMHFNWDNSSRYAAQVAVLHASAGLAYRYQTGATKNDWDDWIRLLNDTGTVPFKGNILYQGTKTLNTMLEFLDNTKDTGGNGIRIGGGGLTIVGAGESPIYVKDKLYDDGTLPSSEILCLTSDGVIRFYTKADASGIADAKICTITTAGHFIETPELLSKTYTQNNYVNETSFNRLAARKVGNLIIVYGNLQITTPPPAATTVTIGKINGMGTCVQQYSAQVPVSNGGSLNITITTEGNVNLYAYTKDAPLITAGSWARFSATLIVTN